MPLVYVILKTSWAASKSVWPFFTVTFYLVKEETNKSSLYSEGTDYIRVMESLMGSCHMTLYNVPTYSERLCVINEHFLNFDSPYVRFTMDRNK